jgi:hypothetical protein
VTSTSDDLPAEGSADDSRWTVGYAEDIEGSVRYHAVRELTDQEVAEYREALTFVLDCKEQVVLRLVVGNYRECRALEAAIAIAYTTASHPQRIDASESLFHLRRILLNWLTSIRLFDDHTVTRLTRMYGRNSAELERYDQARSGEYDGNPSYRFVCELRNYAQHCGQVPIQGSVHVSREAREVELYFDREELLTKYGKWKQVKRDLRSGPEHLLLDDHIEAAMASIVELAKVVAEIDKPRIDVCVGTINQTVGPPPEDSRQRSAIFRVRKPGGGGPGSVSVEILPVVTVGTAAAGPDVAVKELPDFRKDRPRLRAERRDYSCQGPIDRVTDLPAETCGEKASTGFYFPHQEGVAFIFACDRHALALGRWAGRRFGGCFGGEVSKVPFAMELASNAFARVDTPHGDDFTSLVPVPGAPTTSSLFNHPLATNDEPADGAEQPDP